MSDRTLSFTTIDNINYSVCEEDNLIVALDLTLNKELIEEGLINEIVHAINTLRKKCGLEIQDKIEIGYQVPIWINDILTNYREHIIEETLATSFFKWFDVDHDWTKIIGKYIVRVNIKGEMSTEIVFYILKNEN